MDLKKQQTDKFISDMITPSLGDRVSILINGEDVIKGILTKDYELYKLKTTTKGVILFDTHHVRKIEFRAETNHYKKVLRISITI